ncbi:MAG: hypothetical protein HYW10_06490 [Candidatus Omnitrophica bacterium]|nr:hypothetical protein [Candidatus Omnitrophota bacterium]
MQNRWSLIITEFTHHFPYTVVGSLIAMAGAWWFGTQQLQSGQADQLFVQSRSLFHLFHPLHICLSAIATTSLFWRHERHVARAVTVGALGTIVPCGLSDYVFPYLGGRLLGQTMELHACLIDHPQLFFPFLALGIIGGFWAEERVTGSHLFSHGAHVFVSSVASLLYLMSFGFTAWMTDVRLVFPTFLIVVLAVWIPCCISDIVVPPKFVCSITHHSPLTTVFNGRHPPLPRAPL